jgi:hypothetical protein
MWYQWGFQYPRMITLSKVKSVNIILSFCPRRASFKSLNPIKTGVADLLSDCDCVCCKPTVSTDPNSTHSVFQSESIYGQCTQWTTSNSSSIVACMSLTAFTWQLLSHCLATVVFTESFPSNGYLCGLHNSGFQHTCHNINDSPLVSLTALSVVNF